MPVFAYVRTWPIIVRLLLDKRDEQRTLET